MGKFAAFTMAIAALAPIGARGQFVASAAQNRSTDKMQAVRYIYPEQVTLPAGEARAVAMHFRIAPGLHINSHTPSDDYLIPTTFSIPEGAGVRLAGALYPAGKTIALPADPKTKLSVYTGDFTIQTRLVAAAGDHLVQGKLRYQACDQSQCMPPKTITVAVDVIGK